MPLQNALNLDYVIVLCDDMIKMRNFYRDVLNLKINEEAEDWVEMRAGSQTLAVGHSCSVWVLGTPAS